MPRRKRVKAKQSKWDLYKDGISYSALSKWINDRERFRILAVEGLRPGGMSTAIEFGNIFHNLLEWYSDGVKTKTGLQRKLNRWLKDTGANSDTKFTANMALNVMLLYVDNWDDSDKFYIEQEKVFRCPIRLPSGHIVPINGRRDAVYRLGKDQYYLQENKTKGTIDYEWLDSALPFNLQTMMYCYSIREDYGISPSGVLYNIIRRPGLRQKKNEGDTAFFNRINEDITSRPEHYFVRQQVDFGPNDLDNFLKKVLIPLLEGLCVWWESIKNDPFDPWTLSNGSTNPHHYMRPFGVYDSLSRGKGDYFEYVTRNNPVGLVEIDTLFPELKDDEDTKTTT